MAHNSVSVGGIVAETMIKALEPSNVVVDIQKVEDAELDEIWSYVGNNQVKFDLHQ